MISPRRHSPATREAQFAGIEAKEKEPAMTQFRTLLIAAPVALGLLAAPAAHAEWRGHGGGGWAHGGGWGHREGGWGHREGGWGYGHHGGGGALAGALLGLGAAAVIGGVIAAQPPVMYAPPPAYYPAPAYYPSPYYPAPGYGQ